MVDHMGRPFYSLPAKFKLGDLLSYSQTAEDADLRLKQTCITFPVHNSGMILDVVVHKNGVFIPVFVVVHQPGKDNGYGYLLLDIQSATVVRCGNSWLEYAFVKVDV